MSPVIEVNNLGKDYMVRVSNGLIKGLIHPEKKTVHAIKQISFTVEKGEAVAFLGPNGAGKTTTTKMLTGLMYPSSGEAKVLGFIPWERDERYLRRIGLVMGNKAGLSWDLTAMQSFDLLRVIYGIEPAAYQKRVKELAQLLDVEGHLQTQLRRLSLGERMKMELIGAILHKPEVLFLDEPTIGLDILTKKRIRQFLKDLHREGETTFILTSHDMDDIEEVCDRAIIVNKGEKIYDGSLKRLADHYGGSRYVRVAFEDDVTLSQIDKFGEVVSRGAGEYVIRIDSAKAAQTVAEIVGIGQLTDIQIEAVPLEEVIGEVFQGKFQNGSLDSNSLQNSASMNV